MIFVEYIQASMAKGTMGSMISLGIFALIGVFAAVGFLFGLKRGFSKTVIRFVTILASAAGAYFATVKIIGLLTSFLSGHDATTLDALIESVSPGLLEKIPGVAAPIIGEIQTDTASIILMMFFCLFITPFIFIGIFYVLKALTFLVYLLLSGLVGAISYRKGVISTLCGSLFGILLGALIGCIVLLPFTGLFSVVETARVALIDSSENPDQDIESFYVEYLDDVIDNPLLDTIRGWGGEYICNNMLTAEIGGEKINMAEEAKELFRLVIDVKPLTEGFNWEDPSPEHREALNILLEDINNNDLVASLMSDLLRGTAVAVDSGALGIPLEGTLGILAHDTLAIFKTSTRDNIAEDLDIILDVYYIMCDDGIIVALRYGQEDIITDLFADVKPDGKTTIVHITDRLSESERSKPIVSSLTKISVSLIQGSLGLDEEQTKLYEDVKGGFRDVLNHNKSDYDTEEEYRQAISDDLDKTLVDNNITLSDDIKNDMLDYIEENYSETPEITDDDINSALLSYFASHSSDLGSIPGLGGSDDDSDTSTDDDGDLSDKIPEDVLDQLPDGFLGGLGQ